MKLGYEYHVGLSEEVKKLGQWCCEGLSGVAMESG